MDFVNTKLKSLTDFFRQRRKELIVGFLSLSAAIFASVSLAHYLANSRIHSSTNKNLKLLNESHNVIDQNIDNLIEELKIQISYQKEESEDKINILREEIGGLKESMKDIELVKSVLNGIKVSIKEYKIDLDNFKADNNALEASLKKSQETFVDFKINLKDNIEKSNIISGLKSDLYDLKHNHEDCKPLILKLKTELKANDKESRNGISFLKSDLDNIKVEVDESKRKLLYLSNTTMFLEKRIETENSKLKLDLNETVHYIEEKVDANYDELNKLFDATNTTADEINILEEKVDVQMDDFDNLHFIAKNNTEDVKSVLQNLEANEESLRNLTVMYSEIVMISKQFLEVGNSTIANHIMNELQTTLGQLHDKSIQNAIQNLNKTIETSLQNVIQNNEKFMKQTENKFQKFDTRFSENLKNELQTTLEQIQGSIKCVK